MKAFDTSAARQAGARASWKLSACMWYEHEVTLHFSTTSGQGRKVDRVIWSIVPFQLTQNDQRFLGGFARTSAQLGSVASSLERILSNLP
ncbi:MAG: hypothetical protein CMP47_00075 [Rickettsiales bacterium]|nr:hypothetical protein [Rickettsiales bacterium]